MPRPWERVRARGWHAKPADQHWCLELGPRTIGCYKGVRNTYLLPEASVVAHQGGREVCLLPTASNNRHAQKSNNHRGPIGAPRCCRRVHFSKSSDCKRQLRKRHTLAHSSTEAMVQ
jgi:hypothetical protein